jgi:hypothetical protein
LIGLLEFPSSAVARGLIFRIWRGDVHLCGLHRPSRAFWLWWKKHPRGVKTLTLDSTCVGQVCLSWSFSYGLPQGIVPLGAWNMARNMKSMGPQCTEVAQVIFTTPAESIHFGMCLV